MGFFNRTGAEIGYYLDKNANNHFLLLKNLLKNTEMRSSVCRPRFFALFNVVSGAGKSVSAFLLVGSSSPAAWIFPWPLYAYRPAQ